MATQGTDHSLTSHAWGCLEKMIVDIIASYALLLGFRKMVDLISMAVDDIHERNRPCLWLFRQIGFKRT